MAAADILTLALLILVPLALGIALLLLPRAYLRPWGPLLLLVLMLGASAVVVAHRDVPHPYHLMLLIPFGIGWIVPAALMPIRLRRQ